MCINILNFVMFDVESLRYRPSIVLEMRTILVSKYHE